MQNELNLFPDTQKVNTQQFITRLQSRDIKITLENEKLRINAPTGALTSSLTEELKTRKAEIIKYLQAKSFNSRIEIIDRQKEELPLSFTQSRFWFMEQFEPDNRHVYNILRVFKIKQKLNTEALITTFNLIVERHEVFRCYCQTIDSQPILKVLSNLDFYFPIIDLSHLSTSEQKLIITEKMDEETFKPFDLNTPPLLRTQVLLLNDREWVLIINIHHFIADGWSVRILENEISLIYESLINQQPIDLPQLPIQYIDYARWQRDKIDRQLSNNQLNYWQNKLQSSDFVLDLPTDKPRPKIQTYRGNRLALEINKSTFASLKAFTRQQGVTVFMTLLTVFKILLYRYSQQSDIIIGITVSHRPKQELENLIGTFANNLPLRSHLDGEMTFQQLLAEVKKTTIEAFTNQDLPFEQLVDKLNVTRDLSRSPVYQVGFVLHQRNDAAQANFLERNAEPVKSAKMTVQLDLGLTLFEYADKLTGMFQYNTDLFFDERIERMKSHLETLLESAIANPEQKISLLPLLTPEEKQRISIDWNQTQVNYPQNKCIHQLFEEQVVKTPDNIAVTSEQNKITYSQLNQKANKIAHYLKQIGVKPETLVGICLERSIEMIVGVMAILKAGGAYVPIDPNYPQQRLDYILNDAGIEILLTQSSLENKLTNYHSQIVYLDRDWYSIIESQSQANLVTEVDSRNLAYVIYTSGSTGKPKGVTIEHRSVINILWYRIFQQLKPQDLVAFAFISSLSFDVSVIQIFPPLMVGGKLIVVKNLFDEFETLTHQQPITFFSTLPSILERYLDDCKMSPNIEAIGLGGEVVSEKLIHKLASLPHIKRITNSYGPTETTVGSSSNLVFYRQEENAE